MKSSIKSSLFEISLIDFAIKFKLNHFLLWQTKCLNISTNSIYSLQSKWLINNFFNNLRFKATAIFLKQNWKANQFECLEKIIKVSKNVEQILFQFKVDCVFGISFEFFAAL